MSFKQRETTRKIVFVCRDAIGEALRSAGAVKKLERIRLLGICERAPTGKAADVFDDLVVVGDAHDPERLIDAASGLAARHGSIDRIVTTVETLLEPAARAGEVLGVRGMSTATVRRTLDKSSLKRVFRQVASGTASDQVIATRDDAKRFVNEVGLPIVLKPLKGSGGLATWRIRTDEQLTLALELVQPSEADPLLAEVCLEGRELSFDTITIGDEPQLCSICCYRPSILEAVENPRIQWTCLMPRDISGDEYREFIEQGLATVRALEVGSSVVHMEGFLLEAGRVSFTDATLRPAGARIGPMLGFAHDVDPYRAWARVAVDGCFDGPWERKFAVGTIFLRGVGSGRVVGVDGVSALRKQLGNLPVEVRLPRVGATKSVSYTGDGYITLRHPETAVVENALQLIAETLLVTYSQSEPPLASMETTRERWSQHLGYFDQQLNKPTWDDDRLSELIDA